MKGTPDSDSGAPSDLSEDFFDESEGCGEPFDQSFECSPQTGLPASRAKRTGLYTHATTPAEREKIRSHFALTHDLAEVCTRSGRHARVVKNVLCTPEDEFIGRGRKKGQHSKFNPHQLAVFASICTADPWAGIEHVRWELHEALGVVMSRAQACRLRDQNTCKLRIETRPELAQQQRAARVAWVEKVITVGGYEDIISTDEKWFLCHAQKGGCRAKRSDLSLSFYIAAPFLLQVHLLQ